MLSCLCAALLCSVTCSAVHRCSSRCCGREKEKAACLFALEGGSHPSRATTPLLQQKKTKERYKKKCRVEGGIGRDAGFSRDL
mmetsp:Transcript_14034/g.28092  ORF Transcript_14034/g.28092 Transcript_14034/m.28092 type:complete len:83 (-) Transcript_14034:31-279(-)